MITIEKKQDLWILGDVNSLKFEMKVYAPSIFGIKKGSIVKLFIYKKNYRTGRYSCVVQYDRGWNKRGRPKEPRTVIAVKELINFTNSIYGEQEEKEFIRLLVNKNVEKGCCGGCL